MQTLKEYQPTGFDLKGVGSNESNKNWLVLPVIQTRDSEALELSNFESALKILGGESENCEVMRFGHWGPGWFEIIVINPAIPELLAKAEDIERGLADYPVIDEENFSEKETEEFISTLENCYCKNREIAEKVARWLWDHSSICTANELSEAEVNEALNALCLTPESKLESVIEDLSFEEILCKLEEYCISQAQKRKDETKYIGAGKPWLAIAEKLEAMMLNDCDYLR